MLPGKGDFYSGKTTLPTAYWHVAFELCGFEASPQLRSYKRIDVYWEKNRKIKEASCKFKYQQLFFLIKSVLSLSHGNSSQDRGFSINDNILSVHGSLICKNCITAPRIVKDQTSWIEGVLKVPFTKKLILLADLEAKRKLAEQGVACKG